MFMAYPLQFSFFIISEIGRYDFNQITVFIARCDFIIFSFVELLEKYTPDYIIVWGVRLYNALPDLGGHRGVLRLENKDTADYWVYPIKGKEIPALKIHHPSAPTGREWEYWHKVIDKFINL